LTNFAFSKYSEFWISWEGENSAKIYKLILSAKLVFFANVIFFKNQIDFRTQGFLKILLNDFFVRSFFENEKIRFLIVAIFFLRTFYFTYKSQMVF